MEALYKLKELNGVLDFNVQIFDGDINIYAMAPDFHHTDVASVYGYTNIDDAVNDLLISLHNKGYNVDDSLIKGSTFDPEFEYEVLITDSKGIFEQGTWAPITTDRIRRPENIQKYIQHGILRKFNR